jgi:hypothetical protein
MTSNPPDRLEVRHRGGDDVSIKLGNRNLTPALRSVDVYFRAGQAPEVVLRPVVTEWGTDLEGPKVTISADVGLILEHAGWKSPTAVASMEEDLANAHGQLEDLKLANQVLHDELEDLQREARTG